MNSLRLAVFIAIIFILDQIILGFSSFLTVSIAIPTVVFVSTRGRFPRSLVTAFALGFLSDMAALRAFPVMAIYLTLIAIAIDFISKRYVEFRSVMAMFLVTVALYILQTVLLSLLYMGTLTIVSLYSVIISSVVGVITILLFRRVFRREEVGE